MSKNKVAIKLAQELADKFNSDAAAEAERQARIALKHKFDNYRQQFVSLKDQITAVDPSTITNVATAKAVVSDLKGAVSQMGLIQYEMAKDLYELAIRAL